jgi:hypothetical protein
LSERKVESGIGVSAELKPTLNELESKYFSSKGEAFKACVVLAISMNLEAIEPGKVDRAWHAGAAMQDLLDLVALSTGTTTPAAKATALGHTGLVYVKAQLEAEKPFKAIFGLTTG